MSAQSTSGIRSADMFLTRALEKMLSEKEMKKSQSAQLKKQCEMILGKYFCYLLLVKLD